MSSQPPWVVVQCANGGCPAHGVRRRLLLEPAGPGFVRVPPLRCVQCGWVPVEVPAGGGDMPKITVHGGATIGETGLEPVALPAGAEVVAAGPSADPEPVTEPVEPASVDEPSRDEDVADDAAADADGETEDEAGVFDPSAHTVVDVNTYLEAADDAERARVLTAERAGKSRLGILNTWGAP